jgi:hypothetical protein
MSYKPDEKDWMDYLYGELEGLEKERFEHYLLASPEARQQLEKHRDLRGIMASVKDKEVLAPPIVMTEPKQRFLWNSPYIKTIISVAASLLLIILVGKATGTRLKISGSEFRLSFGIEEIIPVKIEQPLQASLTPEQVQQMINASLTSNNNLISASLKENEEKLSASIRKNLAANSSKINDLVLATSTASKDQIREYVSGLQSDNMQMVKDYFQLTSTEQKKYMENLLVDFAQYLQQQRNNDLQVVQTRINSIEQNTDLFKQETEQILTSIITTVGTTPEKEIKN